MDILGTKKKKPCFASKPFCPWFLYHFIHQTNQLTEKRAIFQGEFPISASCNFEVLEVQMDYFWMNCYSIKGLIKAHWSQHYCFYWFQWAMNLSLFSQEYSRAETFLRRERPARKGTKMYHTYQEIQGHSNKGSRAPLLYNCYYRYYSFTTLFLLWASNLLQPWWWGLYITFHRLVFACHKTGWKVYIFLLFIENA